MYQVLFLVLEIESKAYQTWRLSSKRRKTIKILVIKMYTMSGGDKGIWLIVHNQKTNACYYCVINHNIYCQVTKRNLSLTAPIMLILSCQSHSLLISMLLETRERKDSLLLKHIVLGAQVDAFVFVIVLVRSPLFK